MPVCLGCGSSYEDTFQFCPHCGRAKPEDSLIKNEVKQVKAKVEKTNVELEITRLRQEISELKNKREFMYSQNYAWIWGIVIIALLLVVLTFSSRFVFGGIIFLLIAGGAFWFAFKTSQNKSRKIASYTVKINEKEAKVKLNLRKLD